MITKTASNAVLLILGGLSTTTLLHLPNEESNLSIATGVYETYHKAKHHHKQVLSSPIFAPVTSDCAQVTIVVIKMCKHICNRINDSLSMEILRRVGSF